ncbi:mechanosensitive ion channel protein MscS [Oleiphilus sp. HI0009]|uniref:mechanosensitive ion channel family protein n=2 Tax=Oleiphilus TaxID=141450 RepID=UPI0007C295A2|nr:MULTISPECIES: mechanosensitive ion channel family protein [unclassified Oleiphilus]KZX75216.1 mechanosensitive ion channel protein MscS [Oleiphilus sp. HI0009]KZY67016.1 mechanosensitive ion channel protein MscS [Oleiphilus sp. HI0067]KZY72336.1 mechanosensitive ion channel protein MscS [Oleiphilus sp. HI0066]
MDFLESSNQFLADLGYTNSGVRSVIEIFAVVVLTALASYISKRIFKRVEIQFTKTENLWDDALLHAARRPVSLGIWIVGLSMAAYTADQYSNVVVFDFVEPIQRIGVIFCLTWFVVGFIAQTETLLIDPDRVEEPIDETTVHALGKLLRASIIITAVLVVLQTLGFSISGVLAFGGIGGIAVGFAAKDLLANFFGGLMIYLDRPFKVGEWIRSPDQEIEGTVEKIGWRLTTIRTFDKRPLYVPNQAFANISVQNPSRMSHRRIYEKIGVRYDDSDQLENIVAKVKAMLKKHPDIDTKQTLIVNFDSFGASSLDFFIYTFTKTTDWIEYHSVKQDVLVQVINIIEGEGAEFAFPTSTVHLPELTSSGLQLMPSQRTNEG